MRAAKFDLGHWQGFRVNVEDTELIERQIHNLLKTVNKAIRDYRLIEPGDRIAIAVSGGKDSMVLLRLLLAYRATQRQPIDLMVVHVVVEAVPGSQEIADALQDHCGDLGIAFAARPLALNAGESWPLSCQRCTWNRRKTLFMAAEGLGCNKVAMGHHADDVAQTVLLNLIYQARVQGIDPKRSFFDGKIAIIRPLVLLPEKKIASFARGVGYPIGQIVCPGAEDSERAYVAELLRQIEKRAPRVRSNLRRAAERAGSQSVE